MADDLKTQYVVEVLKQGEGAAQAERDLNQLNATKQKSIGIATQLGNAYKFLAGSIIAGLLIREIRTSIAAFSEQEIAVAKLNGTLRASGQFTEEYSRHLQRLAGSLQQVTRFGDETILDVQRQLVAFGAARSEVAELTELVLDLAEGMGTDLPAAALLVGKAIQGEFSTLSRYGIIVNEAATQSEKLAEALAQLRGRFGGLARESADTATGSFVQMKNAIGDLREEVGALAAELDEGSRFSRAVKWLAEYATDVVRAARLGPQAMQDEKIEVAGAGMRDPAFDRPAPDPAEAERMNKLRAELLAIESDMASRVLPEIVRLEQEIANGHADRANRIRELTGALGESEEEYNRLIAASRELADAEQQRLNETIELERQRQFAMSETGKILEFGIRQFSSGFARAFVDFASGTKEASAAFKEFAGNFLATMGEMIIQTIIFNALSSALFPSGNKGIKSAGSVSVTPAADGMMRLRPMASGGLQPSGMPGAFMANGPTVMPHFNALVGEAGPEVLTVLRAPRMLNLGGMLAASGYIGNTGLSLVNTQALKSKFADGGVAGQLPRQFSGLASGGQGGRIVIEVQTSAQAEARIIESSVQGAEVRIVQRMGEDSDVSRATKRLVA
jgi:hypothetical protein